MVRSTERLYQVTAVPTKMLKKNPNRYSWDITNTGGAQIWYMRGARGKDMAIAGEALGIPIANNAADGYDYHDAIEEVYVIAAAANNVIVSETVLDSEEAQELYGTRRVPKRGRG